LFTLLDIHTPKNHSSVISHWPKAEILKNPQSLDARHLTNCEILPLCGYPKIGNSQTIRSNPW